jgi:hypothetical protein
VCVCADSKSALAYISANKHCTGKVGVMGFCIGNFLRDLKEYIYIYIYIYIACLKT